MARNYIGCSFFTLFVHFGIFYGKCTSITTEVRIVKEGATLIWDCSSNGSNGRPASWTLDNEPINQSRIAPNGSLYISNASRTSDEGVYHCHSENEGDDDRQELLVATDCSVSLDPKVIPVSEGDSYEWPCSVNSRGDTEIFWTRDGRWINNTNHHRTHQNGSLHLRNVTVDLNAGIYRCCARNSFGTFCSGKAQFFVSKLPLFTIQPQSNIIRSGTAARLQCSSSGIPSHMAGYNWLHNGHNLSSPPSPRIDGGNNCRVCFLPHGIIQIASVSDSDGGYYQCFNNSFGRTFSANLTLVVSNRVVNTPLDSQRLILAGPTAQDKALGDSALLECLPSRDNLRVSWTRSDNLPIRSQDVSRHGHGNLLFHNLALNDSAIYVCTVTDETTAESETFPAPLKVYEPPVILQPLKLVTSATRGRRLVLKCVANGTQPQHTWLKDGERVKQGTQFILREDGSTLLVRMPRGSDAGVYQCIASNVAGEAMSQTEVRFLGNYPAPPQDLSISNVTSTSFNVQWSEAESGIFFYSVLYYKYPHGEQEMFPTQQTSYTVSTRITPYTEYVVCVIAFSKRTGSDPSETIHVMTSPDKPLSSPAFFLSSTKPGEVNITLLPMLKSLRRGVVLQYSVEYKLHSTDRVERKLILAGNLSFSIGGLQDGQTYSFRLAAATVVGYGPFSDWRSIIVDCTKDVGRPSPQLEISNGTSVSVVWKKGNGSVDGHWLTIATKRKEPIGVMRRIDMPISKATWSNLESNTDYEIVMAGFSQYGDSALAILSFTTQIVVSTTCSVLPPFTIASVSVTSTSLTLVWSEPVTNLKYDGFLIQTKLGEEVIDSFITDPNQRRQLFKNLLPYMNYSFKIRVGCRGGYGESSKALLVTTLEDVPASAPESIHALPLDEHTVNVNWQPPLKPNGIITEYVVLFNKDQTMPEAQWHHHKTDGHADKSVFNQLESGTRYYFKVKAGTHVGYGPSTKPVYTDTMEETEGNDPGFNGMSPKQLGVLIGVGLALLCIILCSTLIVYKYRYGDANTHPIGPPQLSEGPREVVNPKRPYTDVLEDDITTPMLVSSKNCAIKGRVRTTFHNSGHYIHHYPDSTQVLNPSQESSQSSTSTQNPPLDTAPHGQSHTSSRTTAVNQGPRGSVLPPHSAPSRGHSPYNHLADHGIVVIVKRPNDSSQKPVLRDSLLQGETCSTPSPVYSESSPQDVRIKETVV